LPKVPGRHKAAQFIKPLFRSLDWSIIPTETALIVQDDKERVIIKQRGNGEIEQFSRRIAWNLAMKRRRPGIDTLKITHGQNRKSDDFAYHGSLAQSAVVPNEIRPGQVIRPKPDASLKSAAKIG
jgi:hypothetical protein